MAEGFQVALVEGVFYLDGDLLRADSRDVGEALAPLVNRRVHLAAHHLPPVPPNPMSWGGGCCHWQSTGSCPFGHHERPASLFSVVAEGVLLREPTGWFIERFDGTRVALNLEHALPGHNARIAAATSMTVEQMRESAGTGALDALAGRAADLTAVLERLRGGR